MITQKIRACSVHTEWNLSVLDASLRADKPQEPKALHTCLGVAWVAPDWDPSPGSDEWESVSPTIP